MAKIYADENVHSKIIGVLRELGHDVLTASEDGKANQGISDWEVLKRSTELQRIVLTNNRNNFHTLGRKTRGQHAGILTFSVDKNIEELARRIHNSLEECPDATGQVIRVVKPNRSD